VAPEPQRVHPGAKRCGVAQGFHKWNTHENGKQREHDKKYRNRYGCRDLLPARGGVFRMEERLFSA
jgi:hypothetical protein